VPSAGWGSKIHFLDEGQARTPTPPLGHDPGPRWLRKTRQETHVLWWRLYKVLAVAAPAGPQGWDSGLYLGLRKLSVRYLALPPIGNDGGHGGHGEAGSPARRGPRGREVGEDRASEVREVVDGGAKARAWTPEACLLTSLRFRCLGRRAGARQGVCQWQGGELRGVAEHDDVHE
jgi:hypothetical protein